MYFTVVVVVVVECYFKAEKHREKVANTVNVILM